MTAVPRLPAFAVFAAMLAAAGLPLYIHAPKFYVDEYGVSLTALGSALFVLRLLDVVQDPLLGRLAAALRAFRRLSVMLAVLVMALAMMGLFAVTPPIWPLAWFAAMMTLVFSSFSYLTICFYAQGVSAAAGEEQWVALSVETDDEWRALAGVIELDPDAHPDLELVTVDTVTATKGTVCQENSDCAIDEDH